MAEPELAGPVALVADTGEFAGAELYASVLVESLKGRCEFVALLGEHAPDETGERLSDAGAEVRIVPGLRRRPTPRAVARLARELEACKPALVHANLSDQGDGLTTLAAMRRGGLRTMATLHLVIPGRARWREAVSVRALRRFRIVIAVSNAVGRYLVARDVDVVVVKNGLPPTAPLPDARTRLGLEHDALVIGGVGRLHDQKGWDVLCRAAALVHRERPDAVFAVIGDGPQAAALAELPDCAHVRFVGYRPGAAALLSAFDVLVVPSRYEGLGLTPLDALYQGVPVVGSNIGGLAEVLGDCALLVPPDNAEALAKGILRAASDASLRESLATRGRQRAHELFSAERMSEETYEVYTAVANGGAAGTATLRAMGAYGPLDRLRQQ